MLRWSASVHGGPAIRGNAADVADTDGGLVVASAMSAGLFERAPRMDTTVAIDHKVIADRAESSFEMPSSNVFDGEVLAVRGGGAMDYDFGDGTHKNERE